MADERGGDFTPAFGQAMDALRWLSAIYEWDVDGVAGDTLILSATRRRLGWRYMVSIPIRGVPQMAGYPDVLASLSSSMREVALGEGFWEIHGTLIPLPDVESGVSEEGAMTYVRTIGIDVFGMAVWLGQRAEKCRRGEASAEEFSLVAS